MARDLSIELFSPMGASRAAKATVQTFTEPRFTLDKKPVRPDGLVRIEYGKAAWTALVEVKTGSSTLDADQITLDLEHGLVIRDFTIPYPADQGAPGNALVAERIEITIDHQALLNGAVHIRQVDVHGLTVTLRRAASLSAAIAISASRLSAAPALMGFYRDRWHRKARRTLRVSSPGLPLVAPHLPQEVADEDQHDQEQHHRDGGAIAHAEPVFAKRLFEHQVAQHPGRTEGAAAGHDRDQVEAAQGADDRHDESDEGGGL